MTPQPPAWDVSGPVLAEAFVVWLDGHDIALTGPDGPQAWLIEVGAGEHPLAVVDRMVEQAIGRPLLVHSTSWRRDRDAVVLTFLVVIAPEDIGEMPSRRVGRARLARSTARAAPADIAADQVVEHALRHFAWLAQDDPVVREELSDAWRAALQAYVPEPFQHLG